jgi:hypothetical protein
MCITGRPRVMSVFIRKSTSPDIHLTSAGRRAMGFGMACLLEISAYGTFVGCVVVGVDVLESTSLSVPASARRVEVATHIGPRVHCHLGRCITPGECCRLKRENTSFFLFNKVQ